MKVLILLLCVLLSASPASAASWISDPEIELFIVDMRNRHNFDEAWLRACFARTEPDPAVLRLIAPPDKPTQRSWQRYRARFLTPQRISGGVRFWNDNEATVERAATKFGVAPEIIVAIIGVETEYGRNKGNFSVFRALATLAFRYPRRAEFFRGELEQFLLLARENKLDVMLTRGSFAGAIGVPQFMPGSQRRFAVDHDGDGSIDLDGSVADAIGSVASFLAAHGWISHGRVATPARLDDASAAPWLAAGIRPSFDAAQIRAGGIEPGSLAEGEKLALVDLVTPGAESEYWWGFENFYVITRYNRSSFYAMSVYHLAEAIAAARTAPPAADRNDVRSGSRAKLRRAG